MVPKTITAMQSLQMVVGIIITMIAFYEKIAAGDDPYTDPSVLSIKEYAAGNIWRAGELWNEAVVPADGECGKLFSRKKKKKKKKKTSHFPTAAHTDASAIAPGPWKAHIVSGCGVSYGNLVWSLIIYVSYLYLFLDFADRKYGAVTRFRLYAFFLLCKWGKHCKMLKIDSAPPKRRGVSTQKERPTKLN